jgi:Fe-S oxidoreductase
MDLIPPSYYVALTLLLLAALASFAWGLWRIARRIRRGRPLAKPLRERIHWAALVKRGLLTSRVFADPVAGAAHACVFFGSIVLIVGHGLHPLAMAGAPLYEGRVGFWLMGVGREVAGIAVTLGVLFFLLRRALSRGRIAAVRVRRGFAAMALLLLAALVTGFAAEAIRIIADPALHGGEFLGERLAALRGAMEAPESRFRLMWWIHGLVGLGFLALITHSPLVHLVLGPLNSALASRRRGVTLEPIDFAALERADAEAAPTLGAARLADFGQDRLIDFATCVWCGRCHDVCPATQTGKPLSPKGVMLTLAEMLAEERLDDEGMIEAVGMQPIFDCVTCGACTEVCPVSIRPPEAILEMRRNLVMERSELPPTMAAANRNLETREHPFAGTSQSPDAWRRDLDVPIYEPGRTEYLLWLGCAITYEERAQQVARAMVRILQHAGLSFGVLERSRCTGDPAKQLGNELLFTELARQNVDELGELGVQKMITMCAHCFNGFTRYYPELGGRYEVIPHAVLIERLIADGKLAVPGDAFERITFHDPCYLSRHNDIEDEARSVLARVGRVVEMPRSRKQSFCCGAGGANYWGGQGGHARIGDVRAAEALDTGAAKIATACPFCLLMLTDGVKKRTSAPAVVMDIAEIVAARL